MAGTEVVTLTDRPGLMSRNWGASVFQSRTALHTLRWHDRWWLIGHLVGELRRYWNVRMHVLVRYCHTRREKPRESRLLGMTPTRDD